MCMVKTAQLVDKHLLVMLHYTQIRHQNYNIFIFNNYLPKAKLVLLNNPRDEVEGIIQQILTEPKVNNCFSIFTQSDLNRIRKETIKKRLV